MTRINKEIREEIVSALVKSRFTERANATVEANAKLAMSVYDDMYSKTIQKQMNDLPKGWLPTSEQFSVYFGISYIHIYFRGSIHSELSGIADAREDKYLPILSMHKGGCVRRYDATHALTIEYDRIQNERATLVDEIKKARAAAEVAIARAGTIKRLIEAWPEVEPFARRYNTEKPQLPAIRTDELNKAFGLPVDAA